MLKFLNLQVQICTLSKSFTTRVCGCHFISTVPNAIGIPFWDRDVVQLDKLLVIQSIIIELNINRKDDHLDLSQAFLILIKM